MTGLASNPDGSSSIYDQHISQAANQAIVNAFANAPTTPNPDGSHGVHVIIFEGPNYSVGLPAGYAGPYPGGPIPMQNPLGSTNSDGSYNFAQFDSLRNTYFVPTGLAQICHFAVIAHTLGGTDSSGSSRGFGSSDLVVALGGTKKTGSVGVGTQLEQEGTVMHELGHNLGLHHGGGDDTNYKPNYPSAMNYSFQFTGVLGGSAPNGLDYSHGTMSSLDENALNDSLGLGSSATGFGTRYFCGASPNVVFNAASAINWSCNATGPLSGTIPPTDINHDGMDTILNDYNDWANLQFNGGTIGFGARPPLPVSSLIDTAKDPSGAGSNSISTVETKSEAAFTFTGFFSPINTDLTGTVVNAGKAGRTYPVKFQVRDETGSYVSSLSAVRSVTYSISTACSGGTTNPTSHATMSHSGLHYDSTANQYVYNWVTPSPGCYMLQVNLIDGTTKLSLFLLS